MNYYKHHIGDYAKKTGDLSLVEHGAYLIMLHAYYGSEKPLPLDADKLYRVARAHTKTERDAVDTVKRLFWTETPTGLVNGRAFEEMEQATEAGDKSRENGKLGGRPKKTHQVSENEPKHNLIQTPLTTTPKEIHTEAVFAQIKSAYPKGTHRNDLIAAHHACHLRIERNSQTWESLHAKAKAYANYCANGGVSSPQYVMTMQKFFADDAGPWSQEWVVPEKPAAAPAKPKDDALWAEAKSRAAAIGFRPPVPNESATAYMTQVKFEETKPRRAPDVSNLVEKMRIAK